MYMFGVDLRYKGYQVSFLRVEGWLTTQLLPAPGMSMDTTVPLPPLHACLACKGAALPLPLWISEQQIVPLHTIN